MRHIRELDDWRNEVAAEGPVPSPDHPYPKQDLGRHANVGRKHWEEDRA